LYKYPLALRTALRYYLIDSLSKVVKLIDYFLYAGMNIGDVDMAKKEVKESWMLPHMWRANLTGWRPHMRIEKDNDYSAWVEVRGVNNSKFEY